MTDTPRPDATGAWSAGQQPVGRSEVSGHRDGIGVAALVLGVLALALAVLLVFAPIAIVLGLVATILGIVGISRVNQRVASNRGQAVGGLVTGLLGLLIGTVITVSVGSFFATHANDLSSFGQCLQDAKTTAAQRTCAEQFADRVDDNK